MSFPRKDTPSAETEGHTPAGHGEQADVPAEEAADYKVALLTLLRALPPAGFERVCQRLRESGFQQVVGTGRSRDGGIDGHGVLEVNPLVTFKVLFQCQRYADGGSVTSSQVRDFRGAMRGAPTRV